VTCGVRCSALVWCGRRLAAPRLPPPPQKQPEDAAATAAAAAAAAAAATAAANRPKKKRAALLKEREEAAEASRLAALDLQNEDAALTPAQRKARDQAVVEAADFENAKDMFALRSAAAAGAGTPNAASIDDHPRPVSDAEHEAFAALVAAKVATVLVPRRPSKYVGMLKAIVRAAAADLSADDVKELASVCNVLANEKLKERSKADKGKKKKPVKKSLQMERGDFDGGAPSYDDGYDDFM